MNPKSLPSIVILLLSVLACGFPSAPPAERTVNALPPTPILPFSASLAPGGNADIIFTNGALLTMDDTNPSAEALAIDGNKILAVGTNEEVFKHQGQNTIMVDLQGRTLVPGFIDSHAHRLTSRAVDTAGYPSPGAAVPDILAQGWTTINELVAEQDQLDYLTDLDSRGELRVRVNEYLPVNDNNPEGNPRDKWYEVYQQGQMLSPRVRIAGLKVFTDFDNATYLLWEQDELNTFLLEQHQNGWQLAIKTVSTYSLEMILIAIENIQKIDPGITSRHVRLEHVIFATPGQIARIKALGMIPSIQTNNPGQLVGDPSVEALIAREPQGSAFPWRSYVEAGIPIANGAAWPSFYIVPPSGAPMGAPMRLIQQGITREGNSGQSPEPWMLAQSITAEQALRGLTIEAAMGTLQDDILGSLTSGKLADMVILSANPLQTPADQIKDIEILMTMIDGKVEFCAAGSATLCPTTVSQPDPGASIPTPELSQFTGTWFGPDPDDGSAVTVVLIQQGDAVTGTYADTFSRTIPPPGFEGSGSGNLLSDTSARMTFSLTRSSDGKTVELQFTLTLSNQNNTLTLTYEGEPPDDPGTSVRAFNNKDQRIIIIEPCGLNA